MKHNFEWSSDSFSFPDTAGAIQLISIHDTVSGITVRTVSSQPSQFPSVTAWAGARFSRSSSTTKDILEEIFTAKGKSAQEKLADIFIKYGHASVADMAPVMCFIENIPNIYHPYFFYLTSVGGGQVRSTRYQDFSTSKPFPIETLMDADDATTTELVKEYQSLFNQSIELNKTAIAKCTEAFQTHYQITDKKSEQNAMQARVFDTARAFLTNGCPTSIAYITSAREWSRLISVLQSANGQIPQTVATMIQTLLAPAEIPSHITYKPDVPDLVRYTQKEESHVAVKNQLTEFLIATNFIAVPVAPKTTHSVATLKLRPDVIMVVQYVLSIHPYCAVDAITDWIDRLSTEKKQTLGRLLFSAHNHHHPMPNMADVRSIGTEFIIAYSEAVDFNRHRANGRFWEMYESENYLDILNNGYILPEYLNMPEFKELKSFFTENLDAFYLALRSYKATLLNHVSRAVANEIIGMLLPFSQSVRYWFGFSPKQVSYFSKLRVRPGGHINYRLHAWELGQVVAKLSPFYSGLGNLEKPDVTSRSEFLDRS